MGWTVYIDYGLGWVDLTNYGGSNLILDTLRLTEKLHDKKYKPAMSSASFSAILDTTLATNLLAATDDIKCEIYQDGSIWFRGLARPVTKYKNSGNEDTIDFEIFDYGYSLDKAIQGNLTYEDKKICDTSDTTNSIIHLLLSEAGYPASYIGITLDIDVTIPVITFEKGEDFSEVLADILWDYHHVYNVRPDGTIVVYDWAPASIVPTETFDESNIIAGLELKNEDNDYDQAKIVYNEFATETGATVYNRKQEGGLKYDGEFARAWNSDVYWPSSPGQFDYDIDDDGKKKLLRVRNQSLSYSVVRRKDGLLWLSTYGTGSASVVSESHSQSYSTLQFLITDPGDTGLPFYRNLGDELEEITVKGTLDFLIEGNKETSIYSTSNSKGRLQEYRATYIYNDDDAKALADAIITTLEFGKLIFNFSSETEADIGDNVTISNTKLNISSYARIISKKIDKKNNVDIWRYEAVSVSALQTQIGSIVSGGYYLGPTAEQLGDMAEIISAGLSPAGEALQPISGNLFNDEYEPGASGLYVTATELGFYDETQEEFTARIKSDGTFKFLGDVDNFIEWDGSSLAVHGDLFLSGDSEIQGSVAVGQSLTVDGEVVVNSGIIKSGNYSAGSAGWLLDNEGNAEITGTIYASAGSIGGWNIDSTSIISADGRFANRSDSLSVEIKDASGNMKIISGYMSNAPEGWTNKDGDQLGSDDYGVYVGGGNMVVADGAKFENGDYLINHDASYRVVSPLGTDIINLGSLGLGDIGLDIGGMKFAYTLTGGGDSDDTFEDTLTGGGDSSTTMDPLVGGGDSLYGAKGLLYSMADGRLYISGDAIIEGTLQIGSDDITEIDGGKITTGSIKSSGYDETTPVGALKIDLDNSIIRTDDFASGASGKGLKLDAANESYEFHGTIYAEGGNFFSTDGTTGIEIRDGAVIFTDSNIFGGTNEGSIQQGSLGNIGIIGDSAALLKTSNGHSVQMNLFGKFLPSSNLLLGDSGNPWLETYTEKMYIQNELRLYSPNHPSGSTMYGFSFFGGFHTQDDVFQAVQAIVDSDTDFGAAGLLRDSSGKAWSVILGVRTSTNNIVLYGLDRFGTDDMWVFSPGDNTDIYNIPGVNYINMTIYPDT